MTTKIEITDEMVERFGAYVRRHEGCYWKDALDYALNPPEEPEIPVSDGMKLAGHTAWDEAYRASIATPYEMTAIVYRAMEAKRIEEQKGKAPYGAVYCQHTPFGEHCRPNMRSGPGDRRKVRDDAAMAKRDGTGSRAPGVVGRRFDDVSWRKLPYADGSLFRVSDAMLKAAEDAARVPWKSSNARNYAIFSAMRRVELEEMEAERSSQDRRKTDQ